MIALVLALAVISGCLIPWAIRADHNENHANNEMSKP